MQGERTALILKLLSACAPVSIILTHNHRRWPDDKDGNFELSIIITKSFLKIVLTFHELIPWASVRSTGKTKLNAKAFANQFTV